MRATQIVILCLVAAISLNAQSAKRPIALDDLSKMRAVGDPQVSPDGKWVAYTVGTVDADKDKRDTDIWMVSWDGAEQIRLTSTADSSESSPRWSPDNKYLAFLTTRGDESQKKQGAQVWLLNRSGGEAQELTNVKGGVSEFDWSPDGKRLVLVARDPNPDDEPEKKDGWKRKTTPPIVIDRYHFKQDREGYLRELHSHLWLFGMDTRKADPLTSGEFNEQSPAWSPDSRFIVFVSNRTKDPDRNNNSNIYVVEAKTGAQPRQLTSISVNYRGSAGRGSEFQKAIFADWGNKEVVDLIGAVDYLIASGIADPNRLGIGGWSYGGILTDYTIATDSRFKAAFSGAGSALQTSMYGLDQYIRQYDNEIGPPWKAQEQWIRISYPFFHADRIKTPTLFLGGEKDFNVPVAGGEQMYQVLRSLGVDTQLVIYPGQYHTLTTPSYQRDRLERYLGWFNKYLK
jgi:dipeptidyl aminopeptidase/acylaminoacyl peptidase